MSKEPRSFSIDEELKRELELRDNVNASQAVNSFLREFLSATDATQEDVMIREINRQIEEIHEEIEEKEERRAELVERRERIKSQAETTDEEERHEQLQKLSMVPNDPEHMLVQEVADQLDMTPEEALTEAEEL